MCWGRAWWYIICMFRNSLHCPVLHVRDTYIITTCIYVAMQWFDSMQCCCRALWWVSHNPNLVFLLHVCIMFWQMSFRLLDVQTCPIVSFVHVRGIACHQMTKECWWWLLMLLLLATYIANCSWSQFHLFLPFRFCPMGKQAWDACWRSMHNTIHPVRATMVVVIGCLRKSRDTHV